MCNVASAAASAAPMMMGLSVAGLAVQTMGAYGEAQAQRSVLDAQAGIADINARGAEQAAQSALAAGQRQEQSVRLRSAALKSSQRTALAANGFDLGDAGAARLLTSTDVLGEQDVLTTKLNAISSAWGYRTQATNYANDALMKRAGADSISPFMSAATTALTSAGTVADRWYGRTRNAPAAPSTVVIGDGLSQGERRQLGIW